MLVLQRGRRVTASVVDESGQILRPSALIASAPGWSGAWGQTLDGDSLVLSELPHGTVDLELRLGHRRYAFTHNTSVPEVTLVVPPHGMLELSLAESVERIERGRIEARLEHEDDPDFDPRISFLGGRLRKLDPEPLLPGRYRVRLERVWFVDGEPQKETLSGPWTVDVRPGETTRLVLGN